MREDDLFDYDEELEDEELNHLVKRCMQAFDEDLLNKLHFSENEYGDLLDYFASITHEKLVYALSEQAYDRYPYSSDLAIKYINALIINNELEKALSLLEEIERRDPTNSVIFFLFSIIAVKSGKDDMALFFAEKAEELDEDMIVVDYFQTIAINYIERTEYKQADLFIERAERIKGGDVEFYEDLTYCYEEHGEFEKSIYYGLKYIDIDPFNASVWFTLGTVYARTDRFTEAIEAYNFTTSLQPDNYIAILNKAFLYVSQGDYSVAIEAFKEVLEIDSENITAIIGIADSNIAINRIKEAILYFTIGKELDFGNISANAGLAYIYMVNGDGLIALSYLRVIIGKDGVDYERIEPQLLSSYRSTKLVEFLLYHLIALYKMGDIQKFLVEIEEMLSIEEVWLEHLYKLVPSIKEDVSILNFINEITSN